MGMAVLLAAVALRMAMAIAVRGSPGLRDQGLRAPESWREMTMWALVRVSVHATPMTVGSSVSGGAVHASKVTRASFA
jgi:hypothetical protein